MQTTWMNSEDAIKFKTAATKEQTTWSHLHEALRTSQSETENREWQPPETPEVEVPVAVS